MLTLNKSSEQGIYSLFWFSWIPCSLYSEPFSQKYHWLIKQVASEHVLRLYMLASYCNKPTQLGFVARTQGFPNQKQFNYKSVPQTEGLNELFIVPNSTSGAKQAQLWGGCCGPCSTLLSNKKQQKSTVESQQVPFSTWNTSMTINCSVLWVHTHTHKRRLVLTFFGGASKKGLVLLSGS